MAYGQPFYTYPTAGYTAPAPNYNMYSPQSQMPPIATNQPLNAFQGQQQAPQGAQAQQAVIPTKTNVPLVTSLTEAMGRTTELNSDTFYADQDNPLIYRISIDMQGRKTHRTFELKDVTEQEVGHGGNSIPTKINLSEYATKKDLQALRDEIVAYAMSLGFGEKAQAPTDTVATTKPKKTVTKNESEETNKE